MIEKLTLRNFQAHRKLVVDLDPAITVLWGRSDCGKSSIIRANAWVVTNRPSGDAFVRKGKDLASVELQVDGNIVKRSKGKGVNSYELDGQEFKAFGTEVPEPIAKFLNIDPELNLVGQFDPPFWLSKSGGEVSRELNRIVNLTLIDSTLANLAGMLKKARSTAEVVSERLEGAKQRAEALEWVNTAKTDLDACNDVLARLQGIQTRKSDLETAVSNLKTVEKAASVEVPDLADLEKLRGMCQEAQAKQSKLQPLLNRLRESEAAARVGVPDLQAAAELKNKLELAAVKRLTLSRLLKQINQTGDELCQIDQSLASASKDLQAIKTCPLCESPLTH